MATYADIPGLIPQLKRAAIDAYMVSDYGGAAGQMWSIDGGKYTLGSAEVTRPGPSGEGGGDWSGDWDFLIGGGRDDFFQGTFDTIRERIDNAIDHWTANLPDESEMQGLLDSLTDAMVTLGVSPSSQGGSVTASGPIGGYLNLVGEALDEMSGATIEAFKAKFLSQLSRVIANQYAMTVPIGGAVAAELNMWREAKQDVANTVQKALDAMNAVVEGAGPNWELTLKVIGWAAKGAGIFAGPGLKPATEIAGLGVEILTASTASSVGADASADGTCESVLTALEQTMEQIADIILAEEETLQANLDANEENLRNQVIGYDINAADADLGVSDAQAPGVDMIILQPNLIDGIIDAHLPSIAGQLGSAADSLWAGWGNTTFNRPAGIGLTFGPQYFGLLYPLHKSITDLKWEVEAGATSLRLAINDLEQADAASQAALDEHRRKVAEGSGYSLT